MQVLKFIGAVVAGTLFALWLVLFANFTTSKSNIVCEMIDDPACPSMQNLDRPKR
jgi:hypothetical protein